PRLIVQCILRGLEGAKLRNVGARSKCLVAGAGQDHRLDRMILVDGLADRGHLLVHRKGQRIARLRPFEGYPGDAVLDGIEQVFGTGDGGVHGALFLLLLFSIVWLRRRSPSGSAPRRGLSGPPSLPAPRRRDAAPWRARGPSRRRRAFPSASDR